MVSLGARRTWVGASVNPSRGPVPGHVRGKRRAGARAGANRGFFRLHATSGAPGRHRLLINRHGPVPGHLRSGQPPDVTQNPARPGTTEQQSTTTGRCPGTCDPASLRTSRNIRTPRHRPSRHRLPQPKPLRTGTPIPRPMFTVEHPTEGVSRIVMDDGKVNAMGPAFVSEFQSVWDKAKASGDAIILSGNAKAFCAGLDLRTLPTLDPDQLRAFFRSFTAMCHSVVAYERPVVAAVNGPAIAGGAILALAADARVATERASMGLTEVAVGVPFPAPILKLAQLSLPPQELSPAILDAAVRHGEGLIAHGWAHAVVKESVLADACVATAERLAGRSKYVYGVSKRGLRKDVLAAFEAFDMNALDAYMEYLVRPETMQEIAGALARLRQQQANASATA